MSQLLLQNLCDQSLYVGNVLVGARQAESLLGKFAVQIFVWADDPNCEVFLRGSGCALKFNDRYYVVCTKHQLLDVSLEKVGLFVGNRRLLVTSSGAKFYTNSHSGSETDQRDVIAFDFTDPCAEFPELRPLFFDFRNPPPDCSNTEIIAFVSAGFPFAEQNFDVYENKHIGSLKRIVVSQPYEQPSDESLLKAKTVVSMSFNPDGLSGGPLFSIVNKFGDPRAHYAGMMVRANQDYIYFLKSGYILQFLKDFISLRSGD